MIRGLQHNKKGQSTLEYAILIVVVILALIAIQGYLKRGMQGGMREHADRIGSQFVPGGTVSSMTTTSHASVNESTEMGTGATTTTYNDQWTQRTGTENITANLSTEFGQ